MIYLALVLAIGLGYVMGLLQNGIHIHHKGDDVPEEYLESRGNPDVMEYYKQTDGMNQF